jgi:threonine/homoserine/homoserine lactone efflux protein
LTVVKILGAVYLIWLGVTTWRSARQSPEPTGRVRWRLPWLLFWTSVVAAARKKVDTPRFRCGMSRLAGAVLIASGIRTATAK